MGMESRPATYCGSGARKGVRAPRLDSWGRPFTPVNAPGSRRGERPPNAGRTFTAEVYTPLEVQRLMIACGDWPTGIRHRALIALMWRSGLRCAEALALRPGDIDLHRHALTVREGKGGKYRVLGLSDYAWEELEPWLSVRAEHGVDGTSPVFCALMPRSLGGQMGAPMWRETIKRLGREARICKRVHSHGLRHTFAVELERRNVPLSVIQAALGHEHLTTTARYLAHLNPQAVIDAMRSW
jgi:integrase/recombinase XerD